MKSAFENALDFREVGEAKGRVIYQLNTPLVYYSEKLGRIEIPELFMTDLASVPRVPIVYMMWGDRAHREAVLHDYLFRKNSVPVVPFSTANFVFKEALISRGQPAYIYYPMYGGVCLGGKSSYHRLNVEDVFSLDVTY